MPVMEKFRFEEVFFSEGSEGTIQRWVKEPRCVKIFVTSAVKESSV